MKRCQTLLFVILFCCVCIFGCDEGQQMVESVVKPPVAVDLISDPNLAAAVRETLGLTAATPLTTEVLQNLRTFVAPDRQNCRYYGSRTRRGSDSAGSVQSVFRCS